MLALFVVLTASHAVQLAAGPTSFPSYAVLGDGGFQSLGSVAPSTKPEACASGTQWIAFSKNKSISTKASVPGQIHLDLEKAGIIGNTYVYVC